MYIISLSTRNAQVLIPIEFAVDASMEPTVAMCGFITKNFPLFSIGLCTMFGKYSILSVHCLYYIRISVNLCSCGWTVAALEIS